MTHDEFQNWLAYHQDGFPGLGAWLAEHPAQIDFWERTLEHTRYNDAKSATDALVMGNEKPPQGWSNHARRIKELCEQNQYSAPVYYEGQRSSKCPICRDRGVVTVWNPITLRFLIERWIQNGKDIPVDWSSDPEVLRARKEPIARTMKKVDGEFVTVKLKRDSCDAWCNCAAGDAMESRHGKNLRYNSDKMLVFGQDMQATNSWCKNISLDEPVRSVF